MSSKMRAILAMSVMMAAIAANQTQRPARRYYQEETESDTVCKNCRRYKSKKYCKDAQISISPNTPGCKMFS